jgi:hypothetical protein
VSYRDVARLPASRLTIRKIVESALRRGIPPPSLLLSEYATLLAVAPLSTGTRSAILSATGEVQGVSSCGIGKDTLGRHGRSVCATGGGYATRITFDPRTGRVIGLDRSITRVQEGAPELPIGTVVESKAFRR